MNYLLGSTHLKHELGIIGCFVITIKELAAKAGISEVALSRIERDINPAKSKTLRDLSELLRQPISYLGCFEEMP
ncbi:helix-turn-helix domain-containing protein [Paenibacillus farraposensis]|uniref:Helix-turn-helix domain-containing protein n=1 Tax=Paenibacillus farraposensis TaxID=2807095 RepID=A0ABW4DGA8_9BACL|nr:helix-turn-helix transcriptional regulator [Paenibacillus farraposensis]